MQIETTHLNNYSKLLSKIPSTEGNDFLLLDPKRNTLFLESRNSVLAIPFPLSSEDGGDLILSRSELLNLAKLEERLEISPSYYAKGASFRGKLKTSVNRDILNHIPTMFEDFEGEDFLQITSSILEVFTRASNFINSQDASTACQCLHLKDFTVMTSSHKRVFLSTLNLSDSGNELTEGILHNELIQLVLLLGEGTKISKGNNCYLLQNQGVQIIFDARIDVDIFPFTGQKFLNVLESLKKSSKFQLSISETLKQIDFLMYYAKSQTNTKTLVRVNRDKISFLVGDNEVGVPLLEGSHFLEDEEENTPLEKEFYLNLDFLKNILMKMIDNEPNTFTLYENSKVMLLLVEQKEGEEVIMGKINN